MLASASSSTPLSAISVSAMRFLTSDAILVARRTARWISRSPMPVFAAVSAEKDAADKLSLASPVHPRARGEHQAAPPSYNGLKIASPRPRGTRNQNDKLSS